MGSMWKSQEVRKIAVHGQTLRAEAAAGEPKKKNWVRAANRMGCRSKKMERSWKRDLRNTTE